jgi:hypothetical protein
MRVQSKKQTLNNCYLKLNSGSKYERIWHDMVTNLIKIKLIALCKNLCGCIATKQFSIHHNLLTRTGVSVLSICILAFYQISSRHLQRSLIPYFNKLPTLMFGHLYPCAKADEPSSQPISASSILILSNHLRSYSKRFLLFRFSG